MIVGTKIEFENLADYILRDYLDMKAISRLMLSPSPRTISSWKYLIASSIPKTTSKESAQETRSIWTND